MARTPRRQPPRGPRGPSGGLPDMQALMRQAAEMQAAVAARQAELADSTFEGSAGGGVVRATLKGTGELTGVEIDPSVLDPDDPELVGDLVVAAVNAAHRLMTESAGEVLGEVGGMDLGGLDLGGLGDLLR